MVSITLAGVGIYNPSTREVKTGRSRVQGHPHIHRDLFLSYPKRSPFHYTGDVWKARGVDCIHTCVNGWSLDRSQPSKPI